METLTIVRESTTRWFTTAKVIYLSGLLLLAGTVAIGDLVNPSSLHGHSQCMDTVELPLLVSSFLLCAVAACRRVVIPR